MDVFLVARPTGKLLSLAAEVQEKLNIRYRLYDQALPPLHLTLLRINPSGKQDLSAVVTGIKQAADLAPSFKIEARGYLRFGSPHLAVGIAVRRTAALLRLRTVLAERLGDQVVPVAGGHWRPHITLVSAAFSSNAWGEEGCLAAYHDALAFPMRAECAVSELELWYPEYVPKVQVVASFHLMP
ncbi:MAG: 2'-5' RNA ligase family protein [Peptococcaceae bacterium]|nr:2'-5' RNA ligase family protein [Peptococcaceae bacterium]